MKLTKIMTLMAVGLLSSTAARAALIPVTSDIASGTTATWYATNEYRLDTMVYVQTNAVLVIEPGTVIKGGTNTANLIARTGLANLVSGLWVTRGGKLYATGTVSSPIIFTMEGDDVNDPNDIPPTVTGKWGGIVIMGNATINSAQYATGNSASPKYDVYEGVATSPAPQTEHIFGGNNDTDSSGALRYVSIRHTGNTFAPGKELNGLTMGGVGSGTDISYVEVMASSDDGFEWWGGTVSTHHLIGAFNEDDDFDTDQGYRGTNQFWFAIKPTWAGSSDSRGMETDGDLDQNTFGDPTPFSQWTAYNVTLIGRGKTDTAFGGGSAWNARDEAAPNIYNAVIAEFANGLLLDSDGLYHWTNSIVRAGISNIVFDCTTAGNANGMKFISNVDAAITTNVPALLGGISYTNNGLLNPRPQAGSPALTNTILAGAPVAANYRGAFSGDTDNWADGWSGLSRDGFLALAGTVPVNSAPVISAPALNTTYTINVGVNLSVTNTATDSDVPTQTLTFSLVSGSGSITPQGVFTWRPQVADSNTTNVVTVRVTDDGTPNLSADNTFNVVVNPLTQPSVSSSSYTSGQFSLSVAGQQGADYAVQVTTNLASPDWVTVFSTNSPTMPFDYTDTNASSAPQKFYRIIVGPPLP